MDSLLTCRRAKPIASGCLLCEKLSHIMAPIPILEMARAYGLHPRLWLLVVHASTYGDVQENSMFLENTRFKTLEHLLKTF